MVHFFIFLYKNYFSKQFYRSSYNLIDWLVCLIEPLIQHSQPIFLGNGPFSILVTSILNLYQSLLK